MRFINCHPNTACNEHFLFEKEEKFDMILSSNKCYPLLHILIQILIHTFLPSSAILHEATSNYVLHTACKYLVCTKRKFRVLTKMILITYMPSFILRAIYRETSRTLFTNYPR